MNSSSSISKRLVLVPILAVVASQLFLMRCVSSLNMTNAYLHHKCLVSQGKIKPGSLDEKDFNHIIKSLSKDTDAFRYGYSMMAWGESDDMISVTFQCRGDSYGPKCRSCFATAQSELSKRCPRDKGAIIWYDQCMVEFSSFDTTTQINYDDGFCMPSAKNVTGDWLAFEDTLFGLIDEVAHKAVTKIIKITKDFKRPAMYATGEKRVKRHGNKKLYVMVQCRGDLSVKGCEECVSYLILHYQNCIKKKIGGRVLGGSCNFRFELYPFVDPKTGPH